MSDPVCLARNFACSDVSFSSAEGATELPASVSLPSLKSDTIFLPYTASNKSLAVNSDWMTSGARYDTYGFNYKYNYINTAYTC